MVNKIYFAKGIILGERVFELAVQIFYVWGNINALVHHTWIISPSTAVGWTLLMIIKCFSDMQY